MWSFVFRFACVWKHKAVGQIWEKRFLQMGEAESEIWPRPLRTDADVSWRLQETAGVWWKVLWRRGRSWRDVLRGAELSSGEGSVWGKNILTGTALQVFVVVMSITACVWMSAASLPPRSSWVCQRLWSPADTHTDRSRLCWCTLRFCTATSACSVLSTRSHLCAEEERWHETKRLKAFSLHSCAIAPSPTQAMRDRSRVYPSKQSQV